MRGASTRGLGRIVLNGERITGDSRPGEVITYTLTPEEIAQRYGPPVEAERPKANVFRSESREKREVEKVSGEELRTEAGGAQIAQEPKPETKICKKCGEEKPAESFRGRNMVCRTCERADNLERYHAKKAKSEAKRS